MFLETAGAENHERKFNKCWRIFDMGSISFKNMKWYFGNMGSLKLRNQEILKPINFEAMKRWNQETKKPINQETKKLWDQEAKKPKHFETNKLWDQETKKPRNQTTKKPFFPLRESPLPLLDRCTGMLKSRGNNLAT